MTIQEIINKTLEYHPDLGPEGPEGPEGRPQTVYEPRRRGPH